MPGIMTFREVGGDSIEVSESQTYTRVFQAFTRKRTSPNDVRASRQCPQYLSRDRQDPRGYVRRVRVNRDAKVIRLFNVEVEYSLNKIEPNPLDRPAEISWKEAFRQIPITRDLDGKPIINHAGDLIEGVIVDVPYWIATVEKNIGPGPAKWLQKYSNTVNKDTVLIDGLRFKPGTLLCRGLRIGKVTTENDQPYRTAGFELWQNEDGWQLHLWNRGVYERASEYVIDQSTVPAGSAGPPNAIKVDVKKRILDDRGEPVSEPQFLDTDGRAYRVSGKDKVLRLKHPLDPTDLITLDFTIRGELPFRDLPLR